MVEGLAALPAGIEGHQPGVELRPGRNVAGRQGVPLQAVLAQGFGEAGGLGIGLLAGLAGLVEVAAGAGDGLVEGGLGGAGGGAVEQLGAGLAVGVEAGCKLAGRVEGGGAVLAGLAGGVFGSG